MNQQELDKMLKKYYDGTSSKEEEQRLLALLNSDDLSSEYLNEKQLLSALIGNEEIPEPDSNFENRIMQSIDEAEQSGKVRSLKRRIYSAVSVAATVLVILSSYFILKQNTHPEDTFDDPVLAYNATIQLLHQVSESMNSGSEALSDLSIISETRENLVKLGEPVKIMTKEMESLKYLDRSLQLLNIGNDRGKQ